MQSLFVKLKKIFKYFCASENVTRDTESIIIAKARFWNNTHNFLCPFSGQSLIDSCFCCSADPRAVFSTISWVFQVQRIGMGWSTSCTSSTNFNRSPVLLCGLTRLEYRGESNFKSILVLVLKTPKEHENSQVSYKTQLCVLAQSASNTAWCIRC